MNNMIDWIVACFVRVLSKVVQVLPLKVALGLGRFAGRILAHTNRRRVAYVNLKAAFGTRFNARERKEIVTKHFFHLGQNAIEVLRFPQMNRAYFERYIVVRNRECYEQAVRSGHGTVLITPHFGNWELTQILSALVEKPLYVLARQQKHSRLDALLNELRTSHGSSAVHKGGQIRDLIRVLHEGGAVGVLGDLSGGRHGTVVRFFGRKTTAPSGIFEIARRTQATVLPCFMVRREGPYHEVFIEEPFPLAESGGEEQAERRTIQNYYRLLETWIERYPTQWFWIYKRWKYCFTKRILILRDDRAGHTNQSEAIKGEFECLQKTLPADYELEFNEVDVRFKSGWHKKLFFVFAFFFLPFAQGRLDRLRFFLTPECVRKISDPHADLIVSAGSALAPLNLLVKRENLAKSVAMMKPSFPYLARFFDLLVVPVHDWFFRRPAHAVRMLVTPNRVDEELLRISGERLKQLALLQSNGARRISVFIGGGTKSYRFEPSRFREWLRVLKTCAETFRFECLVTTSRRTEPEISAMVKEELGSHPSTKLLVIANESNIDNVTYGMLALSEIALITEDSVSMISEAVSAGKHVLVLKLGNGKLPKKHSRFHHALQSNALIELADATNFRTKLATLNGAAGVQSTLIRKESECLREALRKLL